MPAAAKTIDAYLASLDAGQRAALERLRRQIRAAAPRAEEGFSYGLPAFLQDGPLVAFGASKHHLAFYPMSPAAQAAHAAELAGFDTSKGTVRFTPQHPLPAALVRKLVKARLAENSARASGSHRKALSAAKGPKPVKRSKATAKAAPARGAKAAKRSPASARSTARLDPDVSALLEPQDHPLAKEIDAVRRWILAASPEIAEGVKWNAPSFRTADWFATVNLRSRDRLQLILHKGAKTRSGPGAGAIPDPLGLVKSLGKDRVMLDLGPPADARKRKQALQDLVRAWLAQP